eukprot:15478564-Alexandrium_andersonii.AAC.1
MRSIARAARVAQRLAGHDVWTRWRMADLAPQLVERTRGLAMPEAFRTRCPCGRGEPHQLSVVRLDATQYFKNADTRRAQRA